MPGLSEDERAKIIEALVLEFVRSNAGFLPSEIADAVGFDDFEVFFALYALERKGKVVGTFVPSLHARVWESSEHCLSGKRTL